MKQLERVPIAERIYYHLGNKSKKVIVEIFKPEKSAESGMYLCEVRIKGAPVGLDRMDVGGFDSYQALLLAFGFAKTMIEKYNSEHLDSALRFQSDSDEDLYLSDLPPV